MSQALEQIQLDYVPTEDRLLLKLKTGETLYRAWVTRRYLKLLLPVLQGLHPATGERFTPAPALSFEEDAHMPVEKEPPLEKTISEQPGSMANVAAPMLLTEVQFNAEQEQLALVAKQNNKQINLPYAPTINHALLKVIHQVLPQTAWDLVVEPGDVLDKPARLQ